MNEPMPAQRVRKASDGPAAERQQDVAGRAPLSAAAYAARQRPKNRILAALLVACTLMVLVSVFAVVLVFHYLSRHSPVRP